MSSDDDRKLDQLITRTERLLSETHTQTDPQADRQDDALADRSTAVHQLRAITSDPIILARAGGYFLGAFLRDPHTNPRGLQVAALLDAAGAGREAQAVVVEAMNVRPRLHPTHLQKRQRNT